MSRNQQHDGLEQFFRKGLHEETLMEDSTWDLPSDKVWEGIETRLPKVTARRRFVMPISKTWLMAAASVLLLLLAFDSYVAVNKIGDLQEQMALQSSQLQKLEEGDDNDNYTIPVIPPADNHSIEKKVNAFLAKAGLPASTTTLDKKPLNNQPFQLPAQLASLPVRLDWTTAQMPLVLSNNTISIITKDEASFSLLPLDVVSKEMATLSATPIFQSKNTVTPSILPVGTKKRPFYAGIFAAPSHWFKQRTKKSNYHLEPIAEAKVTKQSGYETGLKIGYQLNDQWALETGISYASNTQSIRHQMKTAYHPENEVPGANGLMESTYASKVNTPYGQADFELQLSRNPNQVLLPGEDLTIDLDNDMTMALLQIPLAARYGLQKGKLNVSLSAGVLLSFLQKQELKLTEARMVSHPQMRHEQLQVKKVEEPALDKMHYGVQTGLQLAYQVSPTVEVYVAPTYAHGLSTVAEKEEGSAMLAQASLQLGVNVDF
jgi:Outer membrane protein beta-barrel domain